MKIELNNVYACGDAFVKIFHIDKERQECYGIECNKNGFVGGLFQHIGVFLYFERDDCLAQGYHPLGDGISVNPPHLRFSLKETDAVADFNEMMRLLSPYIDEIYRFDEGGKHEEREEKELQDGDL